MFHMEQPIPFCLEDLKSEVLDQFTQQHMQNKAVIQIFILNRYLLRLLPQQRASL